MSKIYWLLLSLSLISVNSYAVEPVLDHQGMIYFNMTFDVGQSTKTKHDFGFRFDHAMVEPGENMTMNQLVNKPAVFNIKYDNHGLKAFELNGLDYTKDYYVARADEATTETTTAGSEEETQPIPQEEPRKKIDVPLGVIIGVLIGTVAVAQGF